MITSKWSKSEASSDDLCFDESFAAIYSLSRAAEQTMQLKRRTRTCPVWFNSEVPSSFSEVPSAPSSVVVLRCSRRVSAGYKPIARPIPDERALLGNWHKLGVIKGANLATGSCD